MTADRDAFAVGRLRADASDADFAALYQAHYPTVLLIMRSCLAPMDAEDAAQNTFLRAWRTWPPRHNEVERWLYRIARHALIDAMRRRAVHMRRTPMEYDFPAERDHDYLVESFEDDALEAVTVDNQWQAIDAAWPCLSRREQRALTVSLEERTPRDAARRLGVGLGSYKAARHRGQVKLAKAVRP